MAGKTEAITVEVPEHLAMGIRKQIEEGKFASESEAIVARLQQTDDYSWLPDEPFDGMTDEEWTLEDERRIREFESGAMKFFTPEEVRQHLEATKREFSQG